MKRHLKLVVPFVVLLAGVLGAVALYVTRPAVRTEPTPTLPPLVRVIEVAPRSVQLSVATQGTVVPRTETDLVPEVSGPVVWVAPNLASGGFFEAGDVLLRIDPADYDVALERARANLARAESEHNRAAKELERQQALSKRDFASAANLDDAQNRASVSAAALREARASLEQAERDLARTELRAPFAGRVRSESVDVGQFVNRGAPIARLYAIDYAEIRLPVPDEELAHLDLPLTYRGESADAPGPPVLLRAQYAGAERTWRGRVVRTEGEIDPRTRMVHVIARVEDPYAQHGEDDHPPLAVGLFVEAEILGRVAQNAIVVPRGALRDGNRLLVADAEDRLRYRPAEVLRARHDEVVLRFALEPGDRVVVSSIEAQVEGMPVRPVRDAWQAGSDGRLPAFATGPEAGS